MSKRSITLLLIVGAMLQTMLPSWTAFGSLEAPLITGLIIFIALHTNRSRMMYAAVLAGLLHDAFCSAPLGLSIPFFTILAIGINWIRDEVFGDMPATYAVLGAMAVILETLYYALIFKLSGVRPVPGGLLMLRLAGGLMAGVVVVPLLSLIVLQLPAFTGRNRSRFI